MHGITKIDRGIVGCVGQLGHTWHGFPQYVEIDGIVTVAQALAVVDYEVVKIPMAFHAENFTDPALAKVLNMHGMVPTGAEDEDGTTCPFMYGLVRADKGILIYPESVGAGYTIYQNRTFLQLLNDALLKDNPQVIIESAGTLFAGRNCFINLVLNQFRIGKDPSEQITRIMFYNAFGGKSITACMHFIRVVCNNTLMLAEAQGALNESLRKYRHTSGAAEAVANHIVDLAKLDQIVQDRKQMLEHLTDVPMTAIDVENVLGCLIEIGKDAGKAMRTRRENIRGEIKTIFDQAPDLQGQIKHTRYAMLQAVTCYSQHHTIPENSTEVDEAFAWWDVSTGGVRNTMNQKALEILTKTDIQTPKSNVKEE